MKLTALSGFGTKGPACFLLEAQGRRLLLDLGRGPDGDALPDLSALPGPVEAILISHGHGDHIGGLSLARGLGGPPVFASAPVIALAGPALAGARPFGADVLGLPLDTGPAGHAPGACWMRIGGPEGLLYTGDTCAEGGLWRAVPPPPAAAMVFDASYGAAEAGLAAQARALLALAEGPLLLPAPADGRGLDLALAFRAAGHPVALCPAHLAVARAMRDRADWLGPAGADLAGLLAAAEELTAESPLAGVMIAAPPNAQGGIAGALAGRMVAAGRGQVVFTGHLAQGTPAPGWVAEGRARFLRWNVHPNLAGIAALLSRVRPRQAMAAFCPPDARAALAAALPFPFATTAEMVW